MLKDKKSVRLRTVRSGIDGTEHLVSLENLASTIRDFLPVACNSSDEQPREQTGLETNSYREGNSVSGGNIYRSTSSASMETSIECIYVQNDQFFDSERPASKADNTHRKTVVKTIRGITQRAEAFVRSMVNPGDGPSSDLPVFVVTEVSFWCIRDFGNRLMRTANSVASIHQWSATRAYLETIEIYPKYKRSLKTLGAAIDSYMKRNGFLTGGSAGDKHQQNINYQYQNSNHNSHRQEVIFLLYSKLDDRFDMITLQMLDR